MVFWKQSGSVVVFFVIICAHISYGRFVLPDVKCEALNSGGFRAYIRDTPGITSFHLSANINKNIDASTYGDITGGTTSPVNGYWVLKFNSTLEVGDEVNYWVVVQASRLAYRRTGLTCTITELQDSYLPLTITSCNSVVTVVDGGKATCAGQLIFEDQFEGLSLDTNKWIVEHRIPTYTGPSYEFNTYENRDETRFLENGKLYLKPIAIQSADEVRGTLDLRKGCTATDEAECYYRHASSFLLPPVKSAKITSKFSFKYGKVEIRAKLPAGEWIFPVMALEPKQKQGENSTKLWIAYSRGNNHLTGNDRIDLGSRLLFAGPVIHPREPARSKKLVTRRTKAPYYDSFRVYTLEWIPGKMSFFLDGEEYGEVDTRNGFADSSLGIGGTWTDPEAPFDQEYVLSLGVAVGGFTDFPDNFNSGNHPKPWTDQERNAVKKFFDASSIWSKTWDGDNAALQIEYVKVWAV